MISLQKASGPECPKCGCNDCELVDTSGKHVKRRWAKYACEACKHVFYHGHQPDTCPKCHSENTVATSTPRPLAYRRCRDCGKTYSRGTKFTDEATYL